MRRQRIAVGSLVLLAACATTVNETNSDDSVTDVTTNAEPGPGLDEQLGHSTSSDTNVPPSTIDGSAADLLTALSVEMSRLGSQVADGDGDNETLERIEQIWDQVGPEIERDRPELLNGLTVIIEMARTSVERTRPADADKAFSLLTDIVDQFTGDR